MISSLLLCVYKKLCNLYLLEHIHFKCIMEACYHHRIKKEIATFYLTILTSFSCNKKKKTELQDSTLY